MTKSMFSDIPSEILSFLAAEGFFILTVLKCHAGKRYTFLVEKKSQFYVAKVHLHSYTTEQEELFNKNILAYPDPEFLQEYGVYIPSLLEKTTTDTFTVSLFPHLEGETMERRLKNSPESYPSYTEMVMAVFHKLTKTHLKDSSALYNGKYSWEHRIRHSLHFHMKRLYNREAGMNGRTLKILEHLFGNSDFEQRKNLVHDDLSFGNILIGEQPHPYIVDWDGCCTGDARYSIAKFLYYLHINGYTEFYDVLGKKCLPAFDYKTMHTYLLLVLVEKISYSKGRRNKSERQLLHSILQKIV